MSVKRIARDALLTAAALIIFMIENLFPPLLAFAPGAKLGLSNAVTLIALIISGTGDAFAVLFARCVLGGLLSGNLFSLAYSLPAGLVSLAVQALLYKTLFPKISVVAVSFAGAVIHNAVQLTVASFIVGVNMLAVMPLMMIASTAAGILVGLAAFLAVKLLPKSLYMNTDRREKT